MPVDDFAADITTTGVLPVGGTADGVFEVAGDVDWFKLTLTAGQHLEVSGSLALAKAVFYDAAGNALNADFFDQLSADFTTLTYGFTAPTSGTYYVGVTGNASEAPYTLNAVLTDGNNPNNLSNAVPLPEGLITDTFEVANDVDRFVFNLDAGEGIQIGTNPAVVLRFYNSATGLVFNSGTDIFGLDHYALFEATEAGTYYVSAVSSSPSLTDYHLDAHFYRDDNPTDALVPIGPTGTISGTIDNISDRDRFSMNLTADHAVKIELIFDDPTIAQTHFGLNTEAGAQVVAANGGNSASVTYAPATDGLFWIEVQAIGDARDNYGPYHIVVTPIIDDYSNAAPGSLILNQAVGGAFDYVNDQDRFVFNGVAGQVLRFELSDPTDGLPPIASPRILPVIHGPNGEVVTPKFVAPNSHLLVVTLPATGTYTLDMKGSALATGVEPYAVLMTETTAFAPPPALAYMFPGLVGWTAMPDPGPTPTATPNVGSIGGPAYDETGLPIESSFHAINPAGAVIYSTSPFFPPGGLGSTDMTLVNDGIMWSESGPAGASFITSGIILGTDWDYVVNNGTMVSIGYQAALGLNSGGSGALVNNGDIYVVAAAENAFAVALQTFDVDLSFGLPPVQSSNFGIISVYSQLGTARAALFSNEVTFTNSGVIEVAGYKGAVGVAFASGKTFINSGTLKVTSSWQETAFDHNSMTPAVGVDSGSNLELLNSGIIEAPLAVSVIGRLLLTNEAGGEIRGAIFVSALVGDPDSALVNRGLIDGNVVLGEGTDTLDSTGGVITGLVFMGGGNDIATGGAESDYLIGEAGADVLAGAGGDDILEGGAGNDVLDGGGGFDVASYFDESAGVAISLAVVGAQQTGGSGLDTLISIEGLEGSFFNDVLTGDSGANILDGLEADDVLEGGRGNDRLTGGLGIDTASYLHASAGVSVSLAAVGAQNTVSAGLDTLIEIENLTGSGFGDTLAGDAGNNVLNGGAGVDTLIGGLGNDTLIGGDNTDFIVDLSGVVSIDGGAGNEQITLGAAVVSGTIDGGVGTDQVTKGGSIAGLTFINVEILNTNGGIVTGTAAQFESFDTIRYSAGQPSTAINLVLAVAGTVDLTDELLGRRVIFTGTAGNDTVTTSNGSDNVDGGAGDDVLSGGLGVDTLIGGLGNDTLNGGDGVDFIVDLSGIMAIDAGNGDDVMTVGAGVSSGVIAGGLGTDQLNKGGAINGLVITGIEIVNTNGGTLLATAAQLESFDTIRFSAALATTAVSLALSEAGTVDLTDELLGRRALFAGSSGNDTITTSNGSDQIDGGDGNDVLSGGAGVDTLIGGLGDDSLNGEDGGDFIVDLSGTVAIDAGDGDDVITVSALITTGSVAGGLGAADQLNKSGNLSAITVSGIEILNTNGGTLTATAAQLESFDTIRFSAAQPTATISLVQASAGTAYLTDEVLGRRVLYAGSAGNDVVTLSNGDDRLDGAAGDDTLNGGLGDDLIVQGATDGRDIIDGATGTDTYQLNGTAAAETFRIMTRAEAVLAGITGLAGATEIVITRDGTNNASVIAELDNIEEISINTLLSTANNGNGTVDGGTAAGDTIIVLGDFTTTSLAYSTIHIAGSSANDTVDISGLTSAHRVVFDANGGSDTVVGTPRPQDVFGMSDGLDALTDMTCGLRAEAAGRGMIEASAHEDRTMVDSVDDLQPLDIAAETPRFSQDLLAALGLHDVGIVIPEGGYILG